ncbi:MAG: TonB-dependent receptor [Elusimicrobiota bacterium]
MNNNIFSENLCFFKREHPIKSGTTKTDTFDDREENNFSPRASLVYKISADSRVKASIGQSFRGPTTSELYSGWEYTSSGVRKISLPNQDLKPEKVLSSELGIEKSFADRVSCKAIYFYNQMSDYIYTKKFSSSERSAYNLANYGNASYYGEITQKQNIGKSRSQGLEFEVRAKLSARFETFANCTAMVTEVVENPSNPVSEGKKIPSIPETSVNAGIDYTRNFFTAGIIGRYVGKVYGADDNSDTTTGVFGGYDPFLLVDAKLSYRREISGYVPTISFTCDNIFDKEYYQYYLSPERTYGVNISVSRKF